MKVETPQILWNSEGDKGINAALNSVSMLESGLSDHADDDETGARRRYGHVLVTAGNTHIINLWKLSFPTEANESGGIFQTQNISTKIEYLCSLTRQEQAVNTVAFSPDGLHLATGGETGSIVVWSVPPSKRGNGNGRHYWSTATREQDLNVRIVSRSGEGICDISWSADSKRFIAGTIDHSVFVCEDKHYDANHRGTSPVVDSDWQVIYRNSVDHSQYVQGVAYDPLGVYLTSMGSDRTVRIFPRKTPPKSKKKVLRPANAGANNDWIPPTEHQQMVDQLLTETKLEIGKSKVIKYRRAPAQADGSSSATNGDVNASEHNDGQTQSQVKRLLYADETTLESFFRRLSWTTDGAFLITPAALWHADHGTTDRDKKSPPSFATYLFARHKFDEPFKVLSGLEKPSVVVRPNPVFFKLPQSDVSMPASTTTECKENQSPSSNNRGLPYRSVFAVLTMDSILVYDTHHTRPLSVIRGLHYAGLSDCQWTSDGMKLLVSSIDGYISIVFFQDGELGEVYERPRQLQPIHVGAPTITSNPNLRNIQSPLQSSGTSGSKVMNPQTTSGTNCSQSPKPTTPPIIPPCEPGQSATIEAPPSKRPKKTRIAPTLVSAPSVNSPQVVTDPLSANMNHNNNGTNSSKRPAQDLLENEARTVGEAVTKLTLNNDEKPKKKKRIQPMLVSS